MQKDVKQNVDWISGNGLCMGCGICESACPQRAIQVKLCNHKGIYLPIIDTKLCNRCGMCLKVCPGAIVNLEKLSDEFLDSRSRDRKIGSFESCYIGHASSETIRYNSSSGGLVTALLIYALKKKLIDFALVLGISKTNPLETKPFIASTPSEIISASGSKYCPSAVNKELRNIIMQDCRFAVVGLPCHIHGIRKWEKCNKELRNKILWHFGLFCANNNTYLGTEYFLRQNGIHPEDVKEIRYRSEGWPGKIRVTLSDNTSRIIPRASTEIKWYRKALFSSAFHYDFMIPRCLVCTDHTSELADISFGDPWLSEYKQSDRIGNSIVIIRNRQAGDLLAKVMSDGIVSLREIKIDMVKRAQNYSFKEGAGARIYLRRALRIATPDYGRRDLSFRRRDLLRAFRYLPSYYSYHRCLWPLIRALAIADYVKQISIAQVKVFIRFCLKHLGIKKISASIYRKGKNYPGARE